MPPREAVPDKQRPSTSEKWVSRAILTALTIVAVALLTVQSRFDPSRWRAQSTASPPIADTIARTSVNIPGLRAMGTPEGYDAATLSDKIDGKAELYLAAGFIRLESQRFKLVDDPDRWLEQFIYTMQRDSGAFAVYSQQRRPQARPLGITTDACLAANGLFLVQGNYYLEIIGSDASEMLQAKMVELAQAFIKAHPASRAATDERALFPKEELLADSISLTPANAFGFERFDRIFTADYTAGGHRAMAFISRRASAQDAAGLAAGYADYLLTYGGRKVQAPVDAPPVTVIAIMDQYEIVFQRGDLLAGVHEADNLDYALIMAARLYASLGATP